MTDRPKPPNAGKGRVAGVPNKTTAAVKAALTEAFEKRGGVDALIAWSESEPTEFYKLWAKMLPQDLKADITGTLSLAQLVLGTKPEDS